MLSILLAFTKQIADSFSSVIRKKAIDLNKTGQTVFMFMWFLWWFSIAILMLLFWQSKLSIFFWIFTVLIFLINIFWVIANNIDQLVYKEEKMSVLMPFGNIKTILTIVISFFIFSGQSVVTFVAAIIAAMVIIYNSIDFKTFTVPKRLNLILLANLVWAFKSISLWFFLKTISSIDYFILNNVTYLFIAIFILFKSGEQKKLAKIDKNFITFRMGACFIWNIWTILWLYMIQSLWLVATNLLSFLWLFVSMIFAYFILNDKPSKKDVITTFLVSAIVFVWMYFK